MRAFAAALLVATTFAHAVELEFQPPDRIVWRGDFVLEGYQRFSAIADRHPEARVLEIGDSRGGNPFVTRQMAKTLAAWDLEVQARGTCISGCALVFVSAQRRRMLPGSRFHPTYLHFHGTYSRETGERYVDAEAEAFWLELIERRTDGKLPRELAQRALTVPDPRGGLYVYDRPQGGRSGGRANVFFCAGDERFKPYRCSEIHGESAASLGLVAP